MYAKAHLRAMWDDAGMRRMAVLLIPVALVGAACGGGDEAPSREALVDALIDGGLEPTEAECWVEGAYEELSAEDKQAVQDRDATYDGWENPEAVDAVGDDCLGG
jgi:hypothetical protein